MRIIVKYVTSLLLAVSMVMTPVISTLADTDAATYAHDEKTMPCHEKDSGDAVKGELIQKTDSRTCKEKCKDGKCQEGLCASCAHFVHLTVVTPQVNLSSHRNSIGYQSNLYDSYSSLILSPTFRPPIS
jgi:hypothetical protein